MSFWRHSLCGKNQQFPEDVNPNTRGDACGNCWIAGGTWTKVG